MEVCDPRRLERLGTCRRCRCCLAATSDDNAMERRRKRKSGGMEGSIVMILLLSLSKRKYFFLGLLGLLLSYRRRWRIDEDDEVMH